MTNKKSKLDTLIMDGTDAFMEQVRQEKMLKVLRDEEKYFEENFDAIVDLVMSEELAPKDVATDDIHTNFQISQEETEIFSSGFRRASSKFDTLFSNAMVSLAGALGLNSPPHLQVQIARSQSSDVRETPLETLLGLQPGDALPNWLLWPPIASSSGSNIWEIYLDWFGDDPAPKVTPQIKLLVDGAVVDNLVVDDEDEGRIIFEVECDKPIAFELAETENGALAINLETKSK